jgi:peroxiredoxin
MLQEKIQNYWKNKSTWNKVSDLVFIVFIIAMLIPEGRMAIGGFVNRIKARVMNPAVQENGISLSDQDYYWPMTDLEGNAVNLNDYKGKVVFLNLWATWCPPCVGEMPEIQKLYDTFKSNPDIAFLLVSNEDNEKIRGFVDKRDYTFPVYSSRSPSPEPFSTRSIPTTFVISKKGEIKIRETGAYNWGGSKMVGIIQDLLAE